MTILEKQGFSTASYAGDSEGDDEHHRSGEYGDEKSRIQNVQPGMPPSYADAVPARSSSSRASCSRPTGPPPTNHTSISQTNSKISGHWNLDTSLQVPESLLKPLAADRTERPNLHLHTGNGSINATVSLLSGTGQRANIELDSGNGKIVVAVISRVNSQPFKLTAVTRNGELIVTLPPDFCGALKYHTGNGKVRFSEDMQPVTSTFSEGISFVGDWQAAGFTDFANWLGDEVEVETANGKIQFSYPEIPKETRELPPSSNGARLKKGGGFFGRR